MKGLKKKAAAAAVVVGVSLWFILLAVVSLAEAILVKVAAAPFTAARKGLFAIAQAAIGKAGEEKKSPGIEVKSEGGEQQ